MVLTAGENATRPRTSSLAELLKLLLGLPETTPVHATASFREWGLDEADLDWPPRSGENGGLWLIDTRDRVARQQLARIAAGSGNSLPFQAALVLAGTGRPGSAVRKLLRRIRRPGTRRLHPAAVSARLSAYPQTMVHVLGFEDGLHVPADFVLTPSGKWTGTAYLVAGSPLFQRGLWPTISNCLNADRVEVESFQLRIRGAAVVMLRSAGRRFVIRAVPPGPLQEIVARNHHSLIELRRAFNGDQRLLARVPEPAFTETDGAVALFGESLLEGTLAWKTDRERIAPVVYDRALQFLAALREATARNTIMTDEVLLDLLHEDRRLLELSAFVEPEVKDLLTREFEQAAHQLNGVELQLYASHGDFGFGNILVDERTGEIRGIIDWDTARLEDLPGIDRVNLEIQIRRSQRSIAAAVEAAWSNRSAHDVLNADGRPETVRALFGLAVCRYVIRSLRYPSVYRMEAAGFRRALEWLARTGR